MGQREHQDKGIVAEGVMGMEGERNEEREGDSDKMGSSQHSDGCKLDHSAAVLCVRTAGWVVSRFCKTSSGPGFQLQPALAPSRIGKGSPVAPELCVLLVFYLLGPVCDGEVQRPL